MRDELLYFYEQELAYLRRMGATFAEQYPKVASRLRLEPNKCEDPHVERLLEAFAFLTARVHLKLEDDFSEISEALLSIMYPHYLRPIPAMSLVALVLDPEQGKLTTGLTVPRGAPLSSRPVSGTPCRFRTCYETTLWPLTVTAVQWRTPDQVRPPVTAVNAVAAVRLELRCLPDVTFAKLDLKTLRLYLDGESSLVAALYELLCNNCAQIQIRDLGGPARPPVVLPGTALRPVGFGPEEGMLPLPRRAMVAYRLLQEYFTFPEKFFFLDLDGFDQARAAGFGSAAEVLFLISPFERPERRPVLESGLSPRTLRLGCTPIVNLFEQDAEPVEVVPTRHEYPIVADARRRLTTRIFAIDDVRAAKPGAPEVRRFEPLYSFRHAGAGGGASEMFWYANPRPNAWGPDEGVDLSLAFVDLAGRPAHPPYEAVTARVTCFNGDLPGRLPFGDESGDFTMPGGGPIQKIIALVKPTAVIRPPLGRPQLWRLISQLSLNYLSLVDGGADALQELLRLHNFGGAAAGERQIQGLVDLHSQPWYARVESELGLSFARGHRVEIGLDEDQFAGGSVYLFASVIERFLGLYTALNSFCVLAARTRQRKELLREWSPRAGWKPLV